MNTRWLVVPVALGAMLFALGCNGSVEVPVAANATPPDEKAAELPQAPPPRAKKTTTELLVGEWTRVTIDGFPNPMGHSLTMIFKSDGVMSVDWRTIDRHVSKSGTYKVVGNILTITSDESLAQDTLICGISETELVTQATHPNINTRIVFERAPMK